MGALDVIGVVVSDMARTLAFYRLLGLDISAAADHEQHVDVDLGSGIRLMFDTEELVRSFDASWERPAARGRIGLAVTCSDPTEVNGLHARIVEAGYQSHLEPFDAFWGQRYASVVDPDGIIVDLAAPLDAA